MGLSYGTSSNIVASGTSMTTQYAKSDQHYRIGGQGITILTTVFLILVDKHILRLNDKVAEYLPKVPNSDNITLEMLCNMTTNLPDYVNVPSVNETIINEPFKRWTHKEVLNIVYNLTPLDFAAGTQFNFAHITNTFILSTIMELVTETSMKTLIRKYITKPLKLNNTYYNRKQEIQHPVFHSFTNERVSPSYEDATYWNPSWGTYSTGINSNAYDMNVIARALGTGKFISCKLYNIQMSPTSGIPLTDPYYGLGVGVGGFGLNYLKSIKYPYTIVWSNQTFNGYKGIWAYIPSQDITITLITNTINDGDSFRIDDVLTDFLNTFSLSQIKALAQHK
jgi:CubicO group peptidase (beta-lactamase class C family)